MPPLAAALWVANVLFETAGHMALKSAAAKPSPVVWAGIAAFVAQFAAWLALLSLVPLSQAMLINSITIVTVMVAGRLLFGERLSVLRVGGAALVSIGVALAGAA